MQCTARNEQLYALEFTRPAMPRYEKDGQLARTTGMVHSYKSSRDAILSHVGFGSGRRRLPRD